MLFSAPYGASVILLIVTQALLLIWSYNSIVIRRPPKSNFQLSTQNSVHDNENMETTGETQHIIKV